VQKVLLVWPEKCTGCRVCELACSWEHERVFSPALSRIQVVSWKREGVDVPMVCQQCQTALCMEACTARAIDRDPETGAVLVDARRCIGCHMCVLACPFGGPAIHPETGKIIKCDLCGGSPRCAEMCPVGAIEYVRADRVGLARKRASLGYLTRYLDLAAKEG